MTERNESVRVEYHQSDDIAREWYRRYYHERGMEKLFVPRKWYGYGDVTVVDGLIRWVCVSDPDDKAGCSCDLAEKRCPHGRECVEGIAKFMDADSRDAVLTALERTEAYMKQREIERLEKL